MLVVRGETALSDFRINKKLVALRTFCPTVYGARTEFIYFVDLAAELDAKESERLAILLHADENKKSPDTAGSLIVVPRRGTVSPWSSKATDIIHHCGLEKVRRVERGIAWSLNYSDNILPEQTVLDRLGTLLHDRMTQAVLHKVSDAEALFSENQPKPLATVDILARGRNALGEANIKMGLALSEEEMDYLYDAFIAMWN